MRVNSLKEITFHLWVPLRVHEWFTAAVKRHFDRFIICCPMQRYPSSIYVWYNAWKLFTIRNRLVFASTPNRHTRKLGFFVYLRYCCKCCGYCWSFTCRVMADVHNIYIFVCSSCWLLSYQLNPKEKHFVSVKSKLRFSIHFLRCVMRESRNFFFFS